MKYLLITSLLLSYLPLSAEEEVSPSIELYSVEDDDALNSLEEELTLLDEEFDEFKEELFSLEEAPVQPLAESLEINEPAIDVVLDSEPEVALMDPIEQMIEQTPSALIVDALPAIDFTSVEAIERQANVPPAFEKEVVSQEEAPAILNVQGTALMGELSPAGSAISIDLRQAFSGSPVIYSLLLAMSVTALAIWIYSLWAVKSAMGVSETLKRNLLAKLNSNNFDEALLLCKDNQNVFGKMVSCGIQSRRHGVALMIEAMKAEGKRTSVSFWQKIGMLNDIAIIAPMLGLLGTVLGMFYAFYDVNRSIESISTLFDGLGVSVGTTVAGLVVAILALMLHSTAKYRLVKALATVENEAQNIATVLDDRTSINNKG